jgi:hypothetical protein
MFCGLGMPLNQLGTLCGRSNSSCDAAFFYLLCLSTIHPFDGAKDNLQMLFERNEKRFAELNKQQTKNRNDKTRLVKKMGGRNPDPRNFSSGRSIDPKFW